MQPDQFDSSFTFFPLKGIGPFQGVRTLINRSQIPLFFLAAEKLLKLKIDLHSRDLRCLVQVSIIMAAIKIADLKITYFFQNFNFLDQFQF